MKYLVEEQEKQDTNSEIFEEQEIDEQLENSKNSSRIHKNEISQVLRQKVENDSSNSYYFKDDSNISNKINQSEFEETIRKQSVNNESSKNESNRPDDSKYYDYQHIWEKNSELHNEKIIKSKLNDFQNFSNNLPSKSNFISRMPTDLNSDTDLQRDLLISKSATSFSNLTIENKDKNKFQENKKKYSKYSKPHKIKTQSEDYASLKKNSNFQSDPLNNRSRSKTPVHNPADFIPGQRLYKQFMERLPKKKEYINNILEERRKSEIKNSKFSPSIDRKSEKMATNSPDRTEGIETRLYRYGQRKREKLLKEQTKRALENTFSYHPTVNEKSQIMATIKRRERLEDLSKDKIRKKFNETDIPSKMDYSEIDDKVNSDEELYPTRNFKTSFVSSENTFTNMNVKDVKDQESNDVIVLHKNKKDIEKYKNFTKSDMNVTIKTSRSRSKDKNQYAIISKTSEKTINSNYSLKKDKSPARANICNILNKTSNHSMHQSKSPILVKMDPEKSIHDFLYIEAKVIEQKKQEKEKVHMDKKCPFKPTIPESSKKLVPRQETQGQFIKRLTNSKKEAEELIVRQKRIVDSPIDFKTGKPLFKPTVGRGPKDPKTREVTTNLDSYWDNKILQFKTKVHEEEMLNNLEKKKLFLERSMKSILKMKIEKYKEIFDLLDSDKDGYISSRNIRLSSLDSEMLFALTPLLEEIQKKSLTLSFKDFCLKADTSLSGTIFNPNSNK